MSDLPSGVRDREYQNFVRDILDRVARVVVDQASHDKLDAIIGLLGGSVATPFFRQTNTITTPNTAQTLINETVSVGKTLIVKRVRISCRQNTTYIIKEDSTIIGSGRVGAGNMNDDYTFDVEKKLIAGTVLTVETLSTGKASDIEVYLQALEE